MAQNIGTDLNSLKARIEAEGDNARKGADQKISLLETRVDELSKLVQNIAAKSGQFGDLIAQFQAVDGEQKRQAQKDIGQFDANSKYNVSFCTVSDKQLELNPVADRAANLLKDAGYKASAGCWALMSAFFEGGMSPNTFYVRGAPGSESAIKDIIDTLKKSFPTYKFATASTIPARDRPRTRFFLQDKLDPNGIEIGVGVAG